MSPTWNRWWWSALIVLGCERAATTSPGQAAAPEAIAAAPVEPVEPVEPVAETPQPVAVRINAEYGKQDAAGWTKRFEHDGREVYDRRAEIVAALDLTAGLRVADVGAGSGLFTRLFADAVGPTGRVYAVDVQADFLAQIAARAEADGHAQVEIRRADQRRTGLAPGSIDVAFLCDAYHHLELPKTYLADLRRALVPGGRLVIIDYDRSRPGTDAWMKDHIRADPPVLLGEIEAAGFTPTAVSLRLEENFVAVFTRGDGP
jgi:predicted methyltransferase